MDSPLLIIQLQAFVDQHCKAPENECSRLSFQIMKILEEEYKKNAELDHDRAFDIATEITKILEDSGWTKEYDIAYRLVTFSYFFVAQFFSHKNKNDK